MAIFNSYVKLPEGSHLLSGMIQVVGMALPQELVQSLSWWFTRRSSQLAATAAQFSFHSSLVKRSWDGMRLLKGWVT
jgi:hypothetical protein